MSAKKQTLWIVTDHPENVRVVKPGQRVKGMAPDRERPRLMIVVDDEVDEPITAVQKAKLLDWYTTVMVPALHAEGRVHSVRIHAGEGIKPTGGWEWVKGGWEWVNGHWFRDES
jgi:hypothetical protein